MPVFSQDRPLTSQEIFALEKKIEAVIKDNKIPNENLFYHYLLAGRNLRKRGQGELAIKYYRKGLALPVEQNENRLKAMRELVILLDEQKQYPELISAVNDLEAFSNKLGFIKKHPEFQLTIDFYRVMGSREITRKAIGKDYTHFKGTTFYPIIQDYEFKTRMEQSLFREAYDMFTSHKQDMTDHELRAAHDLLALVTNANPEKWHCEQSLKEFPQSNAYAIQVCKLIEAKRKKNDLPKEKLDELMSSAKELNSTHFIPAIKAL